MAVTIDELHIEIQSSSTEASKGIDKLTQSLSKLRSVTRKDTGLGNVSNQLKSITSALAPMKFGVLLIAAKRVARVMGEWIKESSAYVENLNLFTVSMGKFADEAKRYAETVGDLLGIDPSDWMRNQGVFMTLMTGFGVVEDKAALMSKNLTQLGYDISSYFNISVADAMQKLQSGIAGELEPLELAA